jgi:hypothetical protein
MIKKTLAITAIAAAAAVVAILSKTSKLIPKKYEEIEKISRMMHDDDCPSLYSAYVGCTCGE